MTHVLLRTLGIAFGSLMIAFGFFFWWLTVRTGQDDGAARRWGFLSGASHVALGVLVILGVFRSGAVPYAAAAAGVLVVARVLAARRLRKNGGGLAAERESEQKE